MSNPANETTNTSRRRSKRRRTSASSSIPDIETAKIKIRSNQDYTFDNVPLDKTVLQLKELIEEEVNVPVARQRLVFLGQMLRDEKVLGKDLKMKANETNIVHLFPVPEDAVLAAADQDEHRSSSLHHSHDPSSQRVNSSGANNTEPSLRERVMAASRSANSISSNILQELGIASRLRLAGSQSFPGVGAGNGRADLLGMDQNEQMNANWSSMNNLSRMASANAPTLRMLAVANQNNITSQRNPSLVDPRGLIDPLLRPAINVSLTTNPSNHSLLSGNSGSLSSNHNNIQQSMTNGNFARAPSHSSIGMITSHSLQNLQQQMLNRANSVSSALQTLHNQENGHRSNSLVNSENSGGSYHNFNQQQHAARNTSIAPTMTSIEAGGLRHQTAIQQQEQHLQSNNPLTSPVLSNSVTIEVGHISQTLRSLNSLLHNHHHSGSSNFSRLGSNLDHPNQISLEMPNDINGRRSVICANLETLSKTIRDLWQSQHALSLEIMNLSLRLDNERDFIMRFGENNSNESTSVRRAQLSADTLSLSSMLLLQSRASAALSRLLDRVHFGSEMFNVSFVGHGVNESAQHQNNNSISHTTLPASATTQQTQQNADNHEDTKEGS